MNKKKKQEKDKKLREMWKNAKKHQNEYHIPEDLPMNISIINYIMVKCQMQAQGLSGEPYLDMKTFAGWKEEGLIVKKGEHSTASGLTWIDVNNNEKDKKDEDNEPFLIPKEFKLFHRSQVTKRGSINEEN